MAEKSEKSEKTEKVEKSEKVEKGKGRTFLQVTSLILIIALIAVVLIVVQVPYTATNAVKETVSVEKCAQVDIPFASNFRTGLKYDTASNIHSLNGEALYRYSELDGYLFANIRNTGEEKGVYCLTAQAYLIEDFTNEEDSLALFKNEISQNSDKIKKLDNWASSRYTYPVCTENPIRSTETQLISLWTSALLSKDVQNQEDLDNVYVLFTVVPPTSEKCITEDVEKTTEQEVTRYCNAWKHLVGKC